MRYVMRSERSKLCHFVLMEMLQIALENLQELQHSRVALL